jgi:6-phosphogluconolactonase
MDICAAVKHPESGQNRITLTGKVILNARKLAFLTSGSSKKEILKEIFNEVTEPLYPAAYINHNYSDAYWFVDYDAAESLNHMCHD